MKKDFSELNAKWAQDKKIKELRKIYTNSKARLIQNLKEMPDLTNYKKWRIKVILSQINDEITRLNKKTTKWSIGVIKARYRGGIGLAVKQLKDINVIKAGYWEAQIHKISVNILIEQTVNDLVTMNESIKKNLISYVRRTQQQILTEKQINRQLAYGLIEGEPRKKISNKLYREFRKKIYAGEFVRINGRNYDPVKYGNLVARTRIREATVQASKNTAQQFNIDLIQIDVHTDACPICEQFMGRVYSISGKDKNFPEIEQMPPFHVNCECNLFPVTIESLEARGNIYKLKELSNHPKKPTLNAKRAQKWIDKNQDYAITDYKTFKEFVS